VCAEVGARDWRKAREVLGGIVASSFRRFARSRSAVEVQGSGTLTGVDFALCPSSPPTGSRVTRQPALSLVNRASNRAESKLLNVTLRAPRPDTVGERVSFDQRCTSLAGEREIRTSRRQNTAVADATRHHK